MPPFMDSMAVRAAIYGRGRVPSCSPVPIDRTTLLSLLAATMRAPTAIRNEPLQFIVVQEAEIIQRLSDRIKTRLRARDLCPQLDLETFQLLCRPDFHLFFGTTTLVLIGAKAMGKFTLAACWSAEENLMESARSIGLGTCVIGIAAHALNMPDIKQEFNIPADAFTVAPVIIGLPLGKAAATPLLANSPRVTPRRND